MFPRLTPSITASPRSSRNKHPQPERRNWQIRDTTAQMDPIDPRISYTDANPGNTSNPDMTTRRTNR